MKATIAICAAFFLATFTRCSLPENPSSAVSDELFSEAEGVTPTHPEFFAVVQGKQVGDSVAVPMLTMAYLPKCAMPTRISELNSETMTVIRKFDSNNSASAKMFGFDGSLEKKEMLFIQDFYRAKKVQCDTGEIFVGIGLRCYIHVKSRKGKVGYSKLSGIAANVELNNAQAEYSIKSLGFPIEGKMLANGLKISDEYSVENFGKLAATFATILSTINSDNSMVIDPVVIR